MKYRNFLTSAAVAAVLAASGVANAQLLGGGATVVLAARLRAASATSARPAAER